MVLQECPLGSRSNIQDCVIAAQTLQKAIGQELSLGVPILQAVTDQTAFFSNLSLAFGKRLQEHLTTQFLSYVSNACHHNVESIHHFPLQAAMLTDSAHVRHASSPTLASHSSVHNDLLMYRELTKWLKECQPEIFSDVIEVIAFFVDEGH